MKRNISLFIVFVLLIQFFSNAVMASGDTGSTDTNEEMEVFVETEPESAYSNDTFRKEYELPGEDEIWQFEEDLIIETPVPFEEANESRTDTAAQKENVSLFQNDEEFSYYENEDGSLTISASYYDHNIETLVIPETYHRRTVTRIDGLYESICGEGETGIRSLTIPSTVREIGSIELENLEEVIVDPGNGCFASEDGVLYDSEKTEIVEYPPRRQNKEYSVPESVVKIPYNCFRNALFEEITMDEGVQTIESSAFENCVYLREIELSSALTELGKRAFYGCSSLESIVIPEGVTYIPDGVFEYCYSLKEVMLPEGLTELGEGVFYQCESLESIVIPNGITFIPPRTFAYCTNLHNVEIPNSVTSIGERCFNDTGALKNVDLPVGLASINDYAFCGSGLESVYINSGLYHLGTGVFANCRSLSDVRFAYNISLSGIPAETFYHCNISNIIFPYDIGFIGASAFSGCPLEEINLNRIEYIEEGAFTGNMVSAIHIPSCVREIGANAIMGQNLYEITVDSANTAYTAENNVLYTKDMTHILQCATILDYSTYIMPESVTTADPAAFYGNESLTYAELSSSLTELSENMFSYAQRLRNVKINNGTVNIGAAAFYGCTDLKRITMPQSMKKISASAFSNCYRLSLAEFNEGLESIGSSAFSRCEIKKAELPESLKYLGRSVFSDCELELIVIKSDIEPLVNEAEEEYGWEYGKPFDSLYSVDYIELTEGVTQFNAEWFYASINESFRHLFLPDTVTEITDYIDYDGETFLANRGENLTIYCGEGSYADDWAKANGTSVMYIKNVPDDMYDYYISGNGAVVTGIKEGNDCAVAQIPSLLGGRPVTRIDLYEDKIRSLRIPEGITKVNWGGSALREAKLPSTLESVTGFDFCYYLDKIYLPVGIKQISGFRYNKILSEIMLPEGLETISAGAFCASGLHSIDVPPSVTEIGPGCFRTEYLESITVTAGSQYYINNEMLYKTDTETGHRMLVAVPFGNRAIFSEVYNNETDAYSCILNIPEETDEIMAYALSCYDYYEPIRMIEAVTDIVIPDRVKVIGDYAFAQQWDVRVNIPDSVESIGDFAYYRCSIDGQDIPGSLKFLGECAFSGSDIQTMVIPEGICGVDEYGGYSCGLSSRALAGMREAELVVLPTRIRGLPYGLLSGCTNLKHITIPDSVTEIGSGAFRNSGLIGIDIPEGVEIIGGSAFAECKALEKVNFEGGTQIIADYAFGNCNSLKTISLPEGLSRIEQRAFAECMELEKVIVPKSVSEIQNDAFTYIYEIDNFRGELRILPKLVLQVEPNSYAETYAIENGIPYNSVIIGSNEPYIPDAKDNGLKGEINSDSSAWKAHPYKTNKINQTQYAEELVLKNTIYETNGNNINIEGRIYVENATLNISSGSIVSAAEIVVSSNGIVNIEGSLIISGSVRVCGGKDNYSGGFVNVSKRSGILEDELGYINSAEFGIYDYGYVNISGRVETGDYTVKTSNNRSTYPSGGQLWIENDFEQKTNGWLWFATGKDNFRPDINFDMILEYNLQQNKHSISFSDSEQSMIGNLYIEVGQDQSYPNSYSINKPNLIFGKTADIYRCASRTGYEIIPKTQDMGDAAKLIKNLRQTMRRNIDRIYSYNICSGVSGFSNETNNALNAYLYTYFMGVDLMAPSELKNMAAGGWYIVVPVVDKNKKYDVKFSMKMVSSMGADMMSVNYSLNNSPEKHFATYGYASVNEFKEEINEYFKDEYKSAICKYFNMPVDDYTNKSKDMILQLAWDGIKGLKINGSKKYINDVIKGGIDVYWDGIRKMYGDEPIKLSSVGDDEWFSINSCAATAYTNIGNSVGSDIVQDGVIYFPDDYLAAAIRKVLGLSENADIPISMLHTIESLDLKDCYITDVSGLEYCSALKHLELQGNAVSDITPLINIASLEYIDLRSNNVEVITGINKLTNLKKLKLGSNYINDISDLSNMTIVELDVSNNRIHSIESLTSAIFLEDLDISNNEISDLSPLSVLEGLKVLRCADNSISDISALSGIELYLLDISNNNISDISVINAGSLLSLYAGGNNISDISCMKDWTELTKLDLHENNITDTSGLVSGKELLELNVSHNSISSVESLENILKLEKIDLSYTNVNDLTKLSGAVLLDTINLENVYLNDWSFLSAFDNLHTLNLSESNVHSCDIEQVNLKAIRRFDISGCDISEVDFSDFGPYIEYIDISNTQIEDIGSIITLSGLMTLNVSRIPALNNFETEAVLSRLEGHVDVIRTSPTPVMRGLYFQDETAVISMGQTYFQEALTIPMKSSAEDFVWSSSDTSVASVDSKGEVTAHKNGQAVISASTSDGLYTAEYVLDVEKNMIYNVSIMDNIVLATAENTLETDIDSAQVLLALYDVSGTLKELGICNIGNFKPGSKKALYYNFNDINQGDTVKLMLWDNINTMHPICRTPIIFEVK